jgi:thiamine pyrophosphate-dependent acetolactate synthase large subunit-like protein
MKRLEALEIIDRELGGYPLVVTCGATAREMETLGHRDNRLALLDSMGLTSAVGLGVALGTDSNVCVVDGDGSLLMGFSILPTLATAGPPNLTIVVLDNGQHASADSMPSQAACFDLAAAISGCGLHTVAVDDADSLAAALSAAAQCRELTAVVARIEPGNATGIPFLLADPAVFAHRFAAALRSAKR